LAFKKRVCTELAMPACPSASEKLSFVLAKAGNADAYIVRIGDRGRGLGYRAHTRDGKIVTGSNLFCSDAARGVLEIDFNGYRPHQTYLLLIRSFGVARLRAARAIP
jgi:hypothetical protein